MGRSVDIFAGAAKRCVLNEIQFGFFFFCFYFFWGGGGLGGLLLFQSHHETSGQICETNIMYALCVVLSFSAELEENDEISL